MSEQLPSDVKLKVPDHNTDQHPLYPMDKKISRRNLFRLSSVVVGTGLLAGLAKVLGSFVPYTAPEPETASAAQETNPSINHEIETAYSFLKEGSRQDNVKTLILLGVDLAAKLETAPLPEEWTKFSFSMGGGNDLPEEERYGYGGYLDFDRTQGPEIIRNWAADTGQYVQAVYPPVPDDTTVATLVRQSAAKEDNDVWIFANMEVQHAYKKITGWPSWTVALTEKLTVKHKQKQVLDRSMVETITFQHPDNKIITLIRGNHSLFVPDDYSEVTGTGPFINYSLEINTVANSGNVRCYVVINGQNEAFLTAAIFDTYYKDQEYAKQQGFTAQGVIKEFQTWEKLLHTSADTIEPPNTSLLPLKPVLF